MAIYCWENNEVGMGILSFYEKSGLGGMTLRKQYTEWQNE
jgi:hypothetical protein